MDPKTVYVVDDEPNIRHLIRQYLVREGFRVETFATAEELRERLEVERPDLIVLDIMLPGEDGLEFCRGRKRTGSWAWRSAGTTTWPSPSARASWWPGCARCCAAPRPGPRPRWWRP